MFERCMTTRASVKLIMREECTLVVQCCRSTSCSVGNHEEMYDKVDVDTER